MGGSRLTFAVLVAAGCVRPQLPVPVTGNAEFLAGEWSGSFESKRFGRSGTIRFRLKAGTDSAWGDIALTVNTVLGPPADDPRRTILADPNSLALSIAFIACGGGDVVGQMEPYEDPETGFWVRTTFIGKLDGDALKGTYESTVGESNQRWTGTWSAKRRKAKPLGGAP